jgi:hypothetical protein
MELPTPAQPSRALPCVGLAVEIVHLGASTPAVIEEVRDGGRTLIVAGEAFVLSALTAHYVLAGQPYYGVRLRLSGAAA